VYAGPAGAAAADEAAQRMADTIDIRACAALPPLAAAQEAGRALAAELAERGPVTRWGRESVRTGYRRRQGNRDETVEVTRSAVRRDPEQGYEGGLVRHSARGQEEVQRWTVDARAGKYESQVDLVYDQGNLSVHEERAQAGSSVLRQVEIEQRGRREWTCQPGPAFVPPPVAGIVEGWVARAQAPAAIVEVSSLLGPGTHTVLLRNLPADGDLPRVLVQEDFWPAGVVEAFDDARAETVYERGPSWEYRRLEPEMIGPREPRDADRSPLTQPLPRTGERGPRRRAR
jgi:hypothetical protein